MGRIDFNKVYDRRGTTCSKWDFNQKLFGTDDLISMWVADMDLQTPPEVFEAITERMKHPILGYTKYIPELLSEIVKKRREILIGILKRTLFCYTTMFAPLFP